MHSSSARMAAALLVAAATSLAACAQKPPESPLWLNTAVGAKADCPAMNWNISAMSIGATIGLNGVVWFVDGSGISSARGAATTSGRFDLNVVPVSGNGPRGRVTGFRYPDGSMEIHMSGTGCSDVSIRVPPGATGT